MTVHPTKWPNYHEGDFVIRNYVFRSGEMLPELKLHYRTLGTATRNAFGKIINGVLLLQGNTGTGANWLRPSLADELFGAGQPLDATQFFIIMQDAIGRGGSSKADLDGSRARITNRADLDGDGPVAKGAARDQVCGSTSSAPLAGVAELDYRAGVLR
jgi:homoserine O-acetyltransferase